MHLFSKAYTIDAIFHTLNGDELQVKMMRFSEGQLDSTMFNFTHSTDLNAKVSYLTSTMQMQMDIKALACIIISVSSTSLWGIVPL